MGNFSQITNPETQEMLYQMAIFISIMSPVSIGVVEALKRTFPNIPARFYTLLSIVVAVGIASLGWIFTDLPAIYRLWAGLLAGLSASGLYDAVKNIAKTEEKG